MCGQGPRWRLTRAPPPPPLAQYIVTSLMESDLQKIVASKQPLSEAHARYFLYEVLRGLKYLHTANVLHRDLKPSNLLVNSNCELAICDFGLARGVTGGEGSREDDLTEYVVTRWYRAPELLTECDVYGKAVDIWSVGCIFAEVLLRKPLFRGRDYIHQLNLIIETLGSPKPKDLEFITYEEAKASIRAMKFRPKVGAPARPPASQPASQPAVRV
jgi:serine/threonine protein kinase